MTRSIFRLLVAVTLSLGVLACSGDTDGTGAQSNAGGQGGQSSQSGGALSGEYTVTGTNPDGSPYRGTATITGKGPRYQVDWLVGTGESSGPGTLTGTTFKVRFSGEMTGTGTVTYKLQDDGSLVGTWSVDNSSAKGTETLTPK